MRIAMVPYYLALIVAFVTWFTVICPLAFLTNCTVTNQTDSTIAVTPVGSIGPDAQRTLLPLFRNSFPYFAKSKRGNFSIAPNETLHFAYDMDDVNFSEIFVEMPTGATAQVVVNPNPKSPRYVIPETTNFAIDDFTNLQPVPANVANAAILAREAGGMWMLYVVFAVLLVAECVRIRMATRKPTAGIAG